MVDEFVKNYYSDEEGDTVEYYIVWETSDLCYDVVCVNDDIFRNIRNIREALHYNLPVDVVHELYDYQDQLNYDINGKVNPTNLVSFRN